MHRLLLKPVARVLRPSCSRLGQQNKPQIRLSDNARRSYAEKASSKSKLLLDSLRPDMSDGQLAATISNAYQAATQPDEVEYIKQAMDRLNEQGRNLDQTFEKIAGSNGFPLMETDELELEEDFKEEIELSEEEADALGIYEEETLSPEELENTFQKWLEVKEEQFSLKRKAETEAGLGSHDFARREVDNAMLNPIHAVPEDFVPYPDLAMSDPILDPHDVTDFPAGKGNPFHNQVIVRNHRSVFDTESTSVAEEDEDNEVVLGSEEGDLDEFYRKLPVHKNYYRNLNQSVLMRRRVVQQTGKGKIRRVAFMVLVGDGNGLVGYGEGKHSNAGTALALARIAAVRNMDWVERFEDRTIWTDMDTKLGATRLTMRPRPVGFGLRCNPYLHQILRAAGLKDISAKVWGSRNRLNVIKAAFRMLHAGHAPTAMGDGMGGPGSKLSKGSGMRGKDEIERARGRKLISLRN